MSVKSLRKQGVSWLHSWNLGVLACRGVVFMLLMMAPALSISFTAYARPLVVVIAATAALSSVLWPRSPLTFFTMALWVVVWAGYTFGAGILDYALWRGLAMGVVLYVAHSLLAVTEHSRRYTSIGQETLITWAQHIGAVVAISFVIVVAMWAMVTYVPAMPTVVALPLGLGIVGGVIYILARMVHRSAYESAE